MNEREETRKIQFTGKSSYIVSLPKRWIMDLGLKQGDSINVVRQGSSTLQISPTQYQTKSLKNEDATFEVDLEDENSKIVRRLVSLYFLGFKTINIKPKAGRFKPDQRTAIKDAVKKMLMGTEIISDSTSGITIQVLVNLIELSVNGAFKRMMHLANSMMSDAFLAIQETNYDLAQEIINTDDEVDRFGFYIIRQLKIAIQNEHMLKEMGFKNARNCLGYRLVVKNIERTGDHAVIIAKDLLEFKKPIKKEILAKIREMSEFSLSLLDDSCLALFKEDYNEAEKIIKKSTEITKFEKKVVDSTKSIKDDEEVYRVRRMVENLRRIAEYASDTAEIVLNINVEKILKKPKV
ncbi:MAG TPA: phosphate uptake regulator PhoU [Nitrosopumilaceae archaeon]|nr:phosphate uptake regulator PhoU [Nitrosopumilaceae archaeon]